MSELTVAARYAKSLIDLAKEQDSVEAINTDMDLFFLSAFVHDGRLILRGTIKS